MQKIIYTLKIALFLTAFLNFTVLNAQDEIGIECPSGVCGVDDDFGAIAGTFVENGTNANGTIYSGPTLGSTYSLKCVAEDLGGGFFVYRWEIRNASDLLIYFDSKINFTPFPFSGADNSWTSDNSAFDPAPTTVAVLPVELSFFKLKSNEKTINLSWQTTTEINNEGFEIQHSIDNRNWTVLDFVVGEGTSYETQNYEFTDNKPVSGLNYYRLKQMDYDGDFTYSSVLSQKLTGGSLKIYPNPVNGESINLQFPGLTYSDAQVEIYDNLGRLVQKEMLSHGENQLSISDLPIGIYTVSVMTGGQYYQERLVKK